MITDSGRELMLEGPSQPKTRILIVDDNPADAHLLRLALSDAQLDCEVTVIDDGAEALAFVRQEGKLTGMADSFNRPTGWTCPLFDTTAPDHMRLWNGPKENRARPAVNPLFRSGAQAYGARVTGVILTGGLDDGTAGLAEIKRSGGIAIVQDPARAYCSSMPESALAHVEVDHVAPLHEIPAILSSLATTTRLVEERKKPMLDEPLQKTFSGITCPEFVQPARSFGGSK